MTITLPTIKPLSSRTDAEKAAAREADRATHKQLRALAKKAHNKGCADCTSRSSGWGVLPHGVFVCIHCAQLHRHIGRHISQTKAFNTGTYLWYKDEVAAMHAMGNARANAVYAAKAKGAPPRPDEHASRDAKLSYVRAKYEKRRWFDADAADPLAADANNGAAAGDTVAPRSNKVAPRSNKPKVARAGRRRPSRARARSLLGPNKAPSDGWAEWGTTASEAYDSAQEAASPPRVIAKKKTATTAATPPEDVEADLLDFNDLAVSIPRPAARAEGARPQAGAPLDGDEPDGDYAKKQAFVLSVMRQNGPMVHGGVATSAHKAQACRLFGPPTAATRSHVVPPPQKVDGTGFFESFGLAS